MPQDFADEPVIRQIDMHRCTTGLHPRPAPTFFATQKGDCTQRTPWAGDHFWFGRFDSLGQIALVIQLGYELVERTNKAIKVGR